MLICVESGSNNLETVWLKDVTTSFRTGKRTHDNLDLPDELTFHLTSKSNVLNLNLKRNRAIDPNAEVYIVRTMEDGEPLLDKMLSLEKENLAYYQDRNNGAFLTVKCVKKSNGQCERVINGNVRIGDKDYDIRLAEDDVISRNVFQVPDRRGTQYVLREQSDSERFASNERITDAIDVNVEDVEQELKDLRSHFPLEQDNRNHFLLSKSRNDESFYNRNTIGESSYRKPRKDFVSLVEAHAVQANVVHEIEIETSRRIREYFSHIVNGVNMRYRSITDSGIEISVTLRSVLIFKKENDIALKDSLVLSRNGKTYVEIDKYLDSIGKRDSKFGHNAIHDHAMLFTRHNLYEVSIENLRIGGKAELYGICIPGRRISVFEIHDYYDTVHTATHELGHK
ncbi:hypothetical protein ACJMK2_006893 [Sinanodonta woodiana]|uniref:Peptidase M12B domain-containing protein n=1 Tax=Sinanodonta woodiana TaxID=1069815 RepID=A0ABD3VUL1_SINWO